MFNCCVTEELQIDEVCKHLWPVKLIHLFPQLSLWVHHNLESALFFVNQHIIQ